jgi:hypothetical protein
MASVLDLQTVSGSVGTGGLQAHSSVSIYHCGKKDNSTVSLAWCGTSLIATIA